MVPNHCLKVFPWGRAGDS